MILIVMFLVSQISFGQELVNFSVSSCSEKSYPEYIRSRVIRKEIENDTLELRLGLVLNCCIDPEIILSLKNDSLFVQIDNVSDILCMCECCFEIEITATGFASSTFQVVYKKPEFNINSEDFETIYSEYPLEANSRKYAFPSPDELELHEERKVEMNQLTEDSLKIGLWEIPKDRHSYLTFYVIDEKGKSQLDWYVAYDLDGTLDSISGLDGLGNRVNADRYSYYRLFGLDPSKQ